MVRGLAKEAQSNHEAQKKVSYRTNVAQLDATKIFTETVSSIISVCEMNNDSRDGRDEIWYVLLDNIIDVRDNILKNNEAQRFLVRLCTESVCHIIATIAGSSNLEILLEKL